MRAKLVPIITPIVCSVALLATSATAFAEQTATTEDGKKVLLKDDGTWEYVDKEDDEQSDKKKDDGKSKVIVTAKKGSPQVMPGKPMVMGSLDKAIIRRVVRQHRREIAWCYEKELAKKADLAGRVTAKFTISATGKVIAVIVRSSTLENKAVESCVMSKMRRWVFPEPKGGGIVVVTYPFNFSPK